MTMRRMFVPCDIEVEILGNVCIATLETSDCKNGNGETVMIDNASGIAKCGPGDKFNEEIAIKLSTGRSFEALGKRLQRQARGLVKHADDMKEQKARQVLRQVSPITPEFIKEINERINAEVPFASTLVQLAYDPSITMEEAYERAVSKQAHNSFLTVKSQKYHERSVKSAATKKANHEKEAAKKAETEVKSALKRSERSRKGAETKRLNKLLCEQTTQIIGTVENTDPVLELDQTYVPLPEVSESELTIETIKLTKGQMFPEKCRLAGIKAAETRRINKAVRDHAMILPSEQKTPRSKITKTLGLPENQTLAISGTAARLNALRKVKAFENVISLSKESLVVKDFEDFFNTLPQNQQKFAVEYVFKKYGLKEANGHTILETSHFSEE